MQRCLKPLYLSFLYLIIFAAVDAQKSKPVTESAVDRQPNVMSKFWPPWPFDMLKNRGRSQTKGLSAPNGNANTPPMAWKIVKKRTTVAVRQCREIGASLYCHLPPALPPVILLASIPKQAVKNGVMDAEASRRFVPLMSVPFLRNLAIGGLFVTLISWGDAELYQKRKLTPILQHRSVSKASVTLPPFLPEEIVSLQDEAITYGIFTGDELGSRQLQEQRLEAANGVIKLTERFKCTYSKWKQTREHRKSNTFNAQRKVIYNELVALQSAEKQNGKIRSKSIDASSQQTGFALVTGASTGIGRALATELARWGIPLILVARNQKKLMSLSHDLEACYGVRCYVLPADLSVADAAEAIHRTTTKNDLLVDILVNNAGVATSGLAVDTSMSEIERLLFVNTLSQTKLSILFGRDMAKRQRGRILMVSSMAGLVSSVPNAAVYGATKAFLKSLSLSMSKELEKFGIGVTALMPGAVETNFRHAAGMGNALCWYLPFYSRPVQSVAHLGVTSLIDGDTEVVPGLLNRLFAKVVRPLLPRRLEAICIEAAFKPLTFPPSLFGGKVSSLNDRADEKIGDTKPTHETTWGRFLPTPGSLPKVLQLEGLNDSQRNENKANDQSEVFSGSDAVLNGIDKVREEADDVSPGEQIGKDEELEDKGTGEETERQSDDDLPKSAKRSCAKPTLLPPRESLLQSENVLLP
ncbi:unnamed protein product [Cylindrotheca closterium]|uniref:Uncharacterized protein n=1 Tax=Cylindrotheca closterium TaxID=2856 RepID=A0AAD2CPT9_9STRA|nr:unnamed protein product [Cylindrotheca closterium]